MGRTRRAAFTLVELLVVIAIIGVLVGLLLPAIQRARESSRRSTCLNNIRQAAIAATHFETRLRRYPGLFDTLAERERESLSNERWSTWAVALMPDMEHEPVYELYSIGRNPLPGIYVETLLCPSDASKARSGSVCSYVANAGAALSASDQKPANGPFLNRIYDDKARVEDGHWKDGRDHTLAFSERLDCADYDIIGWNGLTDEPNDLTKDPVDHDVVDEQKADRVWGPAFVWHASPFKCAYINGPTCLCEKSDAPPCLVVEGTGRYIANKCTLECNLAERTPNAKPSSEHSGGVNVAYGSGRATFLAESIDYEVFRSLMTLYDKQSDSPTNNILYDDADLE